MASRRVAFGIFVLVCVLSVSCAPGTEEHEKPQNEIDTSETERKGDTDTSSALEGKEGDEQSDEKEVLSSTQLPISTTTAEVNCTGNATDCPVRGKPFPQSIVTMMKENKGMLTRTAYVLIGVTMIVVVYYIMRAVKLRKKSKTKKYGVISSRDADLEMRPLEEDDDDEDVTVFEVNGVDDFRSTDRR